MGHSTGLLFVNAGCTIVLIGAGTLRVKIGKAPAQRFLIQKVPERIV
jgi:hypothetical protein